MSAFKMLSCALLVAVASAASSFNGTHHFTNSINHYDERAYPYHRQGHNRNLGAACNEKCRQEAKNHRMEANMAEKIRQHDACVKAGQCPMNKPFASAIPCVDGKIAGTGYTCNKIDLLSFTPIAELGSTYDASDSWGWTDPDSGDEIAIIGMMDGTAFVQITEPTNPVVLGFLRQTGESLVIWSDMKVYNNKVYIVRESRNHGMQVFNLEKLREYYNKPSVHVRQLEHDHLYSEVTSTHNIVINEETGFAYLVGTKTCRGGLHAVDLVSRGDPTFAGCFDEDGYTHDAQCVIYRGPDSKYNGKEICFNYNEDTLTIVDVSDKATMKMLSRTTYDNAFYTHQGWLREGQDMLMMNDELDEQNGPTKKTRTLLWDVSQLEKPVLTGSHYATMDSIDHNLYIKGGYGYLTNYCSGLRVLKSTEMAMGTADEVAFFDMVDYCDDAVFKGAWSNYPYFKSGNIVVSNIETGLFILKAHL